MRNMTLEKIAQALGGRLYGAEGSHLSDREVQGVVIDNRQVEKDYAEGKYKNVDDGLIPFPYYNAEYLNAPYDGEMTIAKAYAYLKTLPEFEGAEDV